jgi:WD40 repeat protein
MDGVRQAARAASVDAALTPLLVRNLDTGEARPVMHGTDWTAPAAAAGADVAAPPASHARPPQPSGRALRRTRTHLPRARSDVTGDGGERIAAGTPPPPVPSVPVKVGAHRKGRADFRQLRRFQSFSAHAGPVRALAISPSGAYLASAGADARVHVWRIVADPGVAADDFGFAGGATAARGGGGGGGAFVPPARTGPPPEQASAFLHGPLGAKDAAVDGTPYVTFVGHAMDVVDLSWSKNEFLLTASVDKTVRLWHPSTSRCLRRLDHLDFVTSVTFHPQDEQICVSGSADGVLRLWHLKERKLLSEAETDEVITVTTISPDGKMLLAGTVCGRCKFYGLFDEIQGEWQLIHTTQMDVRSSRGKNKRAARISGISFNLHDPNEVVISSNDSRIRLYRMDDKSVVWKYAGHVCTESAFAGSLSPCGRFVLACSENRQVHIWEVRDVPDAASDARPPDDAGPVRRDRNVSYEYFVPHEHDAVSAALFAQCYYYPRRGEKGPAPGTSRSSGLVIVTASELGNVCVFACM